MFVFIIFVQLDILLMHFYTECNGGIIAQVIIQWFLYLSLSLSSFVHSNMLNLMFEDLFLVAGLRDIGYIWI